MHRAIWEGKVLPVIFFEGQALAPWAIVLDVATTNRIIGRSKIIDGDSETAVWWWRFTICEGHPRREKSKVVLRNAVLLREELTSRSAEYLKEIRRRFKGIAPREILDDWLAAIEKMCELARGVEECEWVAKHDPMVIPAARYRNGKDPAEPTPGQPPLECWREFFGKRPDGV